MSQVYIVVETAWRARRLESKHIEHAIKTYLGNSLIWIVCPLSLPTYCKPINIGSYLIWRILPLVPIDWQSAI